jgi:hypothetical protein
LSKKVETRKDGLYIEGKKFQVRGMWYVRAIDDPIVMGTKPNGFTWKVTDFQNYGFNTVLAVSIEWVEMLRKVKGTNLMVMLEQSNRILKEVGPEWMETKIKKYVGQAIKEELDDHILGYWIDEPHLVGLLPENMRQVYEGINKAETYLFGEKKHPLAVTYWSSYSYAREKGNYIPYMDFLIPDLYTFDTEAVPDGREHPDKCLIEYERRLDDIYNISGDKPVIPLVLAGKWHSKKGQFVPPVEYIIKMVDIARRKCNDNFIIIGWHEPFNEDEGEFLYDQGYNYYIEVLNQVKELSPTPIPPTEIPPTELDLDWLIKIDPLLYILIIGIAWMIYIRTRRKRG